MSYSFAHYSANNIGDIIATAYSASSTYNVGDYCTYGGKVYTCNTKISTAEAWTAAHWTQVKVMGEVDELKEDLESLGLSVVNGKLCITYTA